MRKRHCTMTDKFKRTGRLPLMVIQSYHVVAATAVKESLPWHVTASVRWSQPSRHFFCLCFYCLIWICFLFCVMYFDCRRVFIAWFSICYLFCCSSFFLVCRGKLGCKGNDDAKSCTTLNEGIFSLWADKQTFYPFFVWAFYLQVCFLLSPFVRVA